jgi:PHP family Zn ribbon phosphoesterase
VTDLNKYYVDLHVHIGHASNGRNIKMATAANLTFENIAHEALYKKGISIIGVADCISPHVLRDIDTLVEKGELEPKRGGGMLYRGSTDYASGDRAGNA